MMYSIMYLGGFSCYNPHGGDSMGSSLGDRIRNLRKSQGLTQQQVAEGCNVSIHTVSSWENGKINPTVEHQKVLAQILHTTVDAVYVSPDQVLPSGVLSRQLSEIMKKLTLEEQQLIVEIASGILKLNHTE